MARYMYNARYTVEGSKGLIADGGTARQAAVEKLVASVGGTLESIHFTVASNGVMIIFEVPDTVAAAAIGLTVKASGAVEGEMVELLTPAEFDRAAKQSPAYRPPGK